MIKTEIKEGITLYTVQDKKFKEFRGCILIHRPLTREEVTLNTLVASVVRMQSENFPDAQIISEELEELYPDLDINIYYGGQPLYYYYISAE